MDRSKQREIASKGGKAAHQKGTAHEWTSEEAREAGRKGGMASHRRKQDGGDAIASGAPQERNFSSEMPMSGKRSMSGEDSPSPSPGSGNYGDDDMR